MKKLIYLFLTILIVSCSSDDDNNNGNTQFAGTNPDFVGNWYDSEDDTYIDFNDDGSGQVDGDLISWSTTDTLLNITYTEIEDDYVIFEYVFLNDNRVRLTRNDEDEEFGDAISIIEKLN